MTYKQRHKLRHALSLTVGILVIIFGAIAPYGQSAYALTSPTASAKITFTFDDGFASTYTEAAPTLAKYGLTGTEYSISGCIGMTTAPNTCHANTDATYMSWDQLVKLKNTYGWEIGSHTHSHPYLASSDANDGQPSILTQQQVADELTRSKSEFAAHGIDVAHFSSPYGDYSPATIAEIAKVYSSHRGFADQNPENWPHNDYMLNNYHVEGATTVATVQSKIDTAIANKQWLILTFHGIKTTPSLDPDEYEWSTSQLDQVTAYVKSKQDAGQLRQVSIGNGLVTHGTNMLAGGDFANGLSGGWRTDNATAVTHDTANHGSYPSPANAMRLTSPSTGAAHLFSPTVPVSSTGNYMIKSFINVPAISSGEVAYYIDEYNTAGSWISGQYKKAEGSVWAESMNIPYTPSSANVTRTSLQIIASGTGITAYIDNVQWFALNDVAPPVASNLIKNGDFDAGLANWHTDDSANITLDTKGNGSPGGVQNSVYIKSSSTNKHLFSHTVDVTSSNTYALSSYVKMVAIAQGELGYYIDEYSSTGSWMSGQYKFGVRSVGTGTASFTYVPSSTSVKKASLQIIAQGGSGTQAYVDSVLWTKR